MALAGTLREEMEPPEALFVLDGCHAFVDFLVETGRWTGSEEELDGLRELFDIATTDGDDAGTWQHEEQREWLGLASGEQLDLKAFDADQADAALTVLR